MATTVQALLPFASVSDPDGLRPRLLRPQGVVDGMDTRLGGAILPTYISSLPTYLVKYVCRQVDNLTVQRFGFNVVTGDYFY